jgi:hypothetical protein
MSDLPTENGRQNDGSGAVDPEYYDLLALEDMESLLEEIEEGAGTGGHSEEYSARLRDLGFNSVTELRQRIAELHQQLDSVEEEED